MVSIIQAHALLGTSLWASPSENWLSRLLVNEQAIGLVCNSLAQATVWPAAG